MFQAAHATRAATGGARGDLAMLAREAALGDAGAWSALVQRLDGMLRGVARGFRLAPADVEDVVQTTWLRAATHLGRQHDPAAIVAWLTVTARREALRILQRRTREVPVPDPGADVADPESPESLAIQRERRATLRGAVGRLPARQRRVISSLLGQPALTYEQISAALGMPIGSIGPTRERALARLRRDLDLASVL